MLNEKYNIIIEEGEDGYLIADVIELPGCRTQAKTYDKLINRIKEAIILYKTEKKEPEYRPKFLSLQQIAI
jgi:predicted RNase H-like HicB family nuclease